MISKFTNLFKKENLEEQKAFQSQVLRYLKERHPNQRFLETDDPLVILCGENKLGLSNLYAQFLLTSKTGYELKELIDEHFDKFLSSRNLMDEGVPVWSKIEPSIMPQLMPAEFVDQFPVVSFPFSSDVFLGFVIDSEKAYRYVSRDELVEWNIKEAKLYETAIENLKRKSRDLEITVFPPPNKIAVINTMDSFDAVRIILPGLRKFFAEDFGSPFCFGIPNRDFLVCWSKGNSPEFLHHMQKRVEDDFNERPYPLSRFSFEIDETGNILQLESTAPRNQEFIVNN